MTTRWHRNDRALFALYVCTLVLAAFNLRSQVRIDSVEADLETLRAGSGMGDAAVIQRFNILKDSYNLRLYNLEKYHGVR